MEAGLRRKDFVWRFSVDDQPHMLEACERDDQMVVYLDGRFVASGPQPSSEERVRLLPVPGPIPLTVVVVRFPNRRFRVGTFLGSVNLDDGSRLTDWETQRLRPLDPFEDNLVDSTASQPLTALLLAAAFAFFYLNRHSVTAERLVVAALLAMGTAGWTLFSGRVIIPGLASLRSWPVGARNLAWAGLFFLGLAVVILAAVGLAG